MLLQYSKNLIIGVGLAVLLISLIFFPFLEDISFALREGFVALLAILAAVGLLGIWSFRDELSLGKPSSLSLALLSFGGALVISGLANTTLLLPIKSLSVSPRGSGFAMILLVFLALVVGSFWTKEKWTWFGKGLLGLSFLISLSTFLAFLGVGVFKKLLGTSGSRAVLLNTNQAGIYAGLGFLLGLALFWASRRGKRFLTGVLNPFWEKVVLFLLTSLCGLIVATLGVRFVVLPLFVALVVLIYFLTRGLKNKRIVGLTFLLLLVLILALAGPDWRLKWTQITPEASLTQQASFKVMKSYMQSRGVKSALFGEGWGGYRLLYERYRPASISATSFWQISLSQSANEFWTFLGEVGLVGMLGLFLVLGRFVYLLIKKIRQVRKLDPLKTYNFYGFLFAASSIYLTVVFFMYPFGLGLWALYLFILSGFGALFFKKDRIHFSFDWTKRLSLGLLVLGLCLLLGTYSVRQAAANVFLGRAQVEENTEAKNWNYEMARKILPSYPRVYMIQAESMFKKVLSKVQQGKDISSEQAETRLNRALNLGRKSASLNSRDPQLPLTVSEMYLRTTTVTEEKNRMWEVALEYIDLADQLSPGSPRPPYRRARVFFLIAQQEEQEEKENQALQLAKQSLHESLSKAPNFALADQTLIEIAFFEEEFEKVVKKGKEFVEVYPNNLTVREKIAEAHYELGNLEKAQAQLEDILSRKRSYLPALLTAGRVAAFMENYSKSIDYYSRAQAQLSGSDKEAVSAIITALRDKRNPFERSESQEESLEPQLQDERVRIGE